jgi:hypothetical protein
MRRLAPHGETRPPEPLYPNHAIRLRDTSPSTRFIGFCVLQTFFFLESVEGEVIDPSGSCMQPRTTAADVRDADLYNT